MTSARISWIILIQMLFPEFQQLPWPNRTIVMLGGWILDRTPPIGYSILQRLPRGISEFYEWRSRRSGPQKVVELFAGSGYISDIIYIYLSPHIYILTMATLCPPISGKSCDNFAQVYSDIRRLLLVIANNRRISHLSYPNWPHGIIIITMFHHLFLCDIAFFPGMQ